MRAREAHPRRALAGRLSQAKIGELVDGVVEINGLVTSAAEVEHEYSMSVGRVARTTARALEDTRKGVAKLYDAKAFAGNPLQLKAPHRESGGGGGGATRDAEWAAKALKDGVNGMFA